MSIKKLEEKRNSLQATAQNILATAKAEGRAVTAEEKTTFDNCINEIAEIDDTIAMEDRLNGIKPLEIGGTPGSSGNPASKDASDMEKADVKNFATFIRNSVAGLPNAENSLGKGDNGVVIPTTIAKKIITKVKEISPLYSLATRYTHKGKLVIPVVDNSKDDVTVAYVEEFAAVPEHANKFKSVELTSFMYAAIAKLSKSLINNSDFDLVEWVVNYMAQKIAEFLEKELLCGTADKTKGIYGSYDKEKMSVTLTAVNKITADELIDLQDLVPGVYQANARWIMSRKTKNAIRKLKTPEGDYLLQRDFSKDGGWLLLGKPVDISENAHELGTAGNLPIVYGDFSGLAVKEVKDYEIEILRELYSNINAIGVKCYGEIDAVVENTQKIACAVCPAG